jgi:glycosyltransferase involved in cell wall biosynthesis
MGKNLPFVSVIVPTLNEQKYVENCLKALKSQDYRGKYEIIVADGMSRDNTVKIAKRYADKVVVEKKKGVAAGRNAGAKIAKGEILLFIDADTVAAFNLITEIVKRFKGKVVGVTCPILPLSPNATDFILYWFFNEFVKASITARKPHVVGMLCAYRREAFEKIGGFNEDLKTSEDWDLSKRISKLGEIKFVDSTFVMTSPRRIRKWGKTKAAVRYIKYYLDYLLTGKTVGIDKYRPIR